MNPRLDEIKDKLENAYYDPDAKEWFDGRKHPERLEALFAKYEEIDKREAELEEKYQPQEEHLR